MLMYHHRVFSLRLDDYKPVRITFGWPKYQLINDFACYLATVSQVHRFCTV